MAKKQRLYNATDFDRALRGRRWNERTIRLVREVLVDGRSQAAVVRREGNIGRQRMSQIVQEIREAIRESTPPGWLTDTATLPRAEWRKVRAMERAARAALKKKARRS